MQTAGISRVQPGKKQPSVCCCSPYGHSLDAEATTNPWLQLCQARHRNHIRCTIRKPDSTGTTSRSIRKSNRNFAERTSKAAGSAVEAAATEMPAATDHPLPLKL